MTTFDELKRKNDQLLEEYAEMREATPLFVKKVRAHLREIGKMFQDNNDEIRENIKSEYAKTLRKQNKDMNDWMTDWQEVVA